MFNLNNIDLQYYRIGVKYICELYNKYRNYDYEMSSGGNYNLVKLISTDDMYLSKGLYIGTLNKDKIFTWNKNNSQFTNCNHLITALLNQNIGFFEQNNINISNTQKEYVFMGKFINIINNIKSNNIEVDNSLKSVIDEFIPSDYKYHVAYIPDQDNFDIFIISKLIEYNNIFNKAEKDHTNGVFVDLEINSSGLTAQQRFLYNNYINLYYQKYLTTLLDCEKFIYKIPNNCNKINVFKMDENNNFINTMEGIIHVLYTIDIDIDNNLLLKNTNDINNCDMIYTKLMELNKWPNNFDNMVTPTLSLLPAGQIIKDIIRCKIISKNFILCTLQSSATSYTVAIITNIKNKAS